jgi:hypothetical protein
MLLRSSSVEALISFAIARIAERSGRDEGGGREGAQVSGDRFGSVSVGRCSDGRGSSRPALPRLPHAGVESDGRVVVSSEAVASQHCYRLRWNLRCVHSDCHEVGGVGGKMTGRLPRIRVFFSDG